MEWIRGIGLDAALARHLPPGTLDDGLEGVRAMPTEAALRALAAFLEDAKLKFLKALREVKEAKGSKSAVEANSKFADGFEGSFASLRDFHAGAEATLELGYPNPDTMKGILLEHTAHPSARRLFVTPNYRIATCLLIEYAWAALEAESADQAGQAILHGALTRLRELAADREGPARGCESTRIENCEGGESGAEARSDAVTDSGGQLLFPGEVGDSIVESLVILKISGLDSADSAKVKVCQEAASNRAEGLLTTEEERVRGVATLDHAACVEWIARSVSVLHGAQPSGQAATDVLRVGVLFPLPLGRVSAYVDKMRAAVAAAAAVAPETVVAEATACKTWEFCRHTGLEGLRKWLGELSLDKLREEIASDVRWAVISVENKAHKDLCSEMAADFVRIELQADLRAALRCASNGQIEALLEGWRAPEPRSASLPDRIDTAVAALVSEERWGQVEGWVRLYRGRIQGRTRLGLKGLMARERVKIEQCALTAGEALALYLYTGPEFVPINGICRSHPPAIRDLLRGDGAGGADNRLCTTLFCISSALKKLSQTTALPGSMKVYRGLGKMQLPAQFWVPHGDLAWRGGVERAFMSTTADKGVALFYANGRGTVVEISVGRIQIGGDVSFLSMVPPPPPPLPPSTTLAHLSIPQT
jgi:hypothetical protein